MDLLWAHHGRVGKAGGCVYQIDAPTGEINGGQPIDRSLRGLQGTPYWRQPPRLKPPILMPLLAESLPAGSNGASHPASACALLV